MSPSPPSSALTISVAETLELLDAEFGPLAQAVSEGSYTFWLGSGISRSRVDGLQQIISRVLEFLQARIDFSDPNCLFKAGLEEALSYASLSSDEQKDVRFDHPIATWPIFETVLKRLTTQYSKLLNIRIYGQKADFLVWEAVDVVSSFASIGIDPDCEHYCIAVLALEGVLSNIVSANWDGLVERALDDLSVNRQAIMSICVAPEDFREPHLRSRLIKMHGCAIRAREDEVEYRQYLVGTEAQIRNWPHDHMHTVMRNAMVLLATTSPTLMIGLSGQDTNIQDIFVQAKQTMAWPWPCQPPALVFAEDALGSDQRTILQLSYGDYYDSDGPDIEASAHLRAYAKPLLLSLVLRVLSAKLVAFAELADAPTINSVSDRELVAKGITALRNVVATYADGDRTIFIGVFLATVSRAMALFQEGIEVPIPAPYRPLSGNPVHEVASEATLRTSGMPEFAFALGLLGLGHKDASWVVTGDVSTGDPRRSPVVAVTSTGASRLYFAANSNAAVQLEVTGAVNSADNDAVIIHSMQPVAALPRSPVSAPGRTGRVGPRHVDMRDLLLSANDMADLQRLFRESASL